MYLCLITTTITLIFFTTTKKATSSDSGAATIISYASDIAPLLEQSCMPCHFPDGVKMKFLDTYKAVKDNIDNIIYKVKLPVVTDGFMPF